MPQHLNLIHTKIQKGLLKSRPFLNLVYSNNFKKIKLYWYIVLNILISVGAMAQPKILVIVAHPNLAQSEVNRQLLQAISNEKDITIHNLYKTYPDERINIANEQKLLETHQIIVFQFPLYWFSAPSLLKKWQDEVVTSKFVLGKINPLKDKKLLIVTSAGGTQNDFRHGGLMNLTIDETLAPYEAFATLCQMKYLSPFVTYGVPNPQILNIPLTAEEKKTRQQYIDNQAKAYLEYLKKLAEEK